MQEVFGMKLMQDSEIHRKEKVFIYKYLFLFRKGIS